jgi:hypothetical protein
MLGGFIVESGSLLLDGSLEGQLERMRRRLASGQEALLKRVGACATSGVMLRTSVKSDRNTEAPLRWPHAFRAGRVRRDDPDRRGSPHGALVSPDEP